MKILVPIKQVLDIGLNVHIKNDVTDSSDHGLSKIMNPFCAIALEEAVRLKEQGLASEVVVVSISDDSAKAQLKNALASGADRCLLIQIDSEQPLCSLDIAKLLSKVVKEEVPDLIIMGKQSIDNDNNQTGQMLSALLDWPQVTAISKLSLEGQKVTVEREIDDGVQTLSFNLPGLVTADLRLNEPRFASLPDIMKAQSKPMNVLKGADFDYYGSHHHELLEIVPPKRNSSLEMLGDVNDLADIIRTYSAK